jgi:hypothetical protein
MVITSTLPPATAEIRPITEEEDGAIAHGRDGYLLRRQMQAAMRQWVDRAERTAQGSEIDHASYRHLPFQVVGKRQVRYREVAPLSPRQIDFDD